MALSSYVVVGMTCDHCVGSVQQEIGKIAGVDSVAVELTTGEVTVTSSTPVADTDVRAAVEEAGYTLSGATPRGVR